MWRQSTSERLRNSWRPFAALFAALFILGACQTAPPPEWADYVPQAEDIYPGQHWAKAAAPEDLGWSSELLTEARSYSSQIGTTAVMVIHKSVVVEAWGSVTAKSYVHSIRKSLMSGLIGIAVDRGQIDLSATLGELGIDDNAPSLTDLEKTATVADLLKARSGIYHAAHNETEGMTNSKPPRGSQRPGSLWHYNNWDFNTLGTIYEQQSGRKIFEAFKTDFAEPLQMEDYEVSDGNYTTGAKSIHPGYPVRMSARDLARFALLYLRQGRWKDTQIVSADWVRESTASHSSTAYTRYPDGGYGYMWWTGQGRAFFRVVQPREHSYYAAGWGHQYAFVFPYLDLVVVHRINTDWSRRFPRSSQVGQLLWLILAAGGETDHGPDPRPLQ